MDGEGRRRVWLLYGWFSGLTLCGSCFGAVAWGLWMKCIVFSFMVYDPSSTLTNAQSASLFAQLFSWLAAFMIMYAMEFLCLSAAKLMVLDRMMDFAMPKGEGISKRWVVGGRVVMAAVVAGNMVGLGGNVAAAVYFQHTAEYYSAASAAFAINNTVDGNKFNNLGNNRQQQAIRTQSLQSFCEVAVLLLIIVAFAVVGAACARRVGSLLRLIPNRLGNNSSLMEITNAAAASGRHLRRQIVGTATFVFVTFLLRAVYSTMFALANELQNEGAECHNNACSSCYNVYRLMQLWLIYTPEFQQMVELISSPLALLVALWGMTSDRTLQQMQSNQQQMGKMRKGPIPETC